MTLNIILAVVSFAAVTFIMIKRKGLKVTLIMLAILSAFLIIAGVGGLIINPFL